MISRSEQSYKVKDSNEPAIKKPRASEIKLRRPELKYLIPDERPQDHGRSKIVTAPQAQIIIRPPQSELESSMMDHLQVGGQLEGQSTLKTILLSSSTRKFLPKGFEKKIEKIATDKIDKFIYSRKSTSRKYRKMATTRFSFLSQSYLGGKQDIADENKLKEFEKEFYYQNEKEDRRYTFWEAIKEAHITPTLLCFGVKNAAKRTIFDKSGPGLSIYFNIIKSTILFFIIALLLTIPLQLTNISLYKASNNLDLISKGTGLSSSFFGAITSTTFGVTHLLLILRERLL